MFLIKGSLITFVQPQFDAELSKQTEHVNLDMNLNLNLDWTIQPKKEEERKKN